MPVPVIGPGGVLTTEPPSAAAVAAAAMMPPLNLPDLGQLNQQQQQMILLSMAAFNQAAQVNQLSNGGQPTT